jgi:hypothetical protein
MIINLKELSDKSIESTVGSTKMRLSENASSMVFQLFTKNVYSNPIGTVVREITSNCFDSHVEAKVNKPIIIRKFTDAQANTEYISFVDFGMGISPDRIANIYGVYFESTKRVDNEQIGGFGLGSKTPMAYKRSSGAGEGEYDNSFYVITVFDKIKYFYLVYEGSESPMITLLHEEETTEGNGTEIRIPVLAKDVQQFSKEMVRQLYYFENIVFEGFDKEWKYGDILTNDYQIVRGKSFLFRGGDYSDYAHICLGRVAYPIDYQTLGLSDSDYRLPIALKLEIGEINVVVSRESVDYSESTIKMLKKKLIEAKTEIATMLAKQYEDIVTLEQYFQVKADFGKLYFANGKSMYVGNLIKQSDVTFNNFAYSYMKVPNDKQLFRLFFDVKAFGKKQSRSRYSSSNNFDGGYKELQSADNIFSVEGDFNRKVLKQAYLKHEHSVFNIISKRNLVTATLRAEVNELFGVTIAPTTVTGVVDPLLQKLFNMQDDYFEIVQKHAPDYDDLVVPDDFIAERKAMRSQITAEMRKQTIAIKFAGTYGRGERVSLSALFDFRMPIFYGTAEDEYKLKEAVNIYNALFDDKHQMVHYDSYGKTFSNRNWNKQPQSIMFIQLANNNVKYMQYCQNAIPIKDFFWKMLHRKESVIKQYFQVYQIVDRYYHLENICRDENVDKLSPVWGQHIKDLKTYITNIPEKAKDDTIGRMKSVLSKYFDLSDIKMDKEQEGVMKAIEDLKFFYEVNYPVLQYLRVPSNLSYADAELIVIMQKLMTF